MRVNATTTPERRCSVSTSRLATRKPARSGGTSINEGADQDDRRLGSPAVGKQGTEVSVRGDDHPVVLDGEVHDVGVRRPSCTQVPDVDSVVTRRDQKLCQAGGRGSRLPEVSRGFLEPVEVDVGRGGGVLQRLRDVVPFEVRVVVEDLLESPSRSDQTDDGLDRDP